MSCNNNGSVLEQINSKHKQKLLKANNFKNRFIRLWEQYGTFLEENGEKYFDDYKIDGNGEGAVAMSKLLQDPELHTEVSNSKLDYVKLFLNFNKILELSSEDIALFKTEYIETMNSYEFDKLYYKISVSEVVESFFVKYIYETQVIDGEEVEVKIDEEIIEDDFLDELSWEIAERRRVGYGGQFPIDLNDGLFEPVEFVEYDGAVTHENIESMMSSLYDAYPNYGEDETSYMIPSLYDKILDHLLLNDFGTDVLDSLVYASRFLSGEYKMSVTKAKRMNGIAFMKVISDVLDFKTKTKSKYFYRSALVSIVVFVVAAVLIYTGNVSAGVGLLLSFGASVTQNKTLKHIAQVYALYSLNLSDGLFNLTYTEAISLVMNVASIYYSLKTDTNLNEEKIEDSDTAQKMLYEMPYDIYDEMHCYDSLISVSVEN